MKAGTGEATHAEVRGVNVSGHPALHLRLWQINRRRATIVADRALLEGLEQVQHDPALHTAGAKRVKDYEFPAPLLAVWCEYVPGRSNFESRILGRGSWQGIQLPAQYVDNKFFAASNCPHVEAKKILSSHKLLLGRN